MLLLLVQNELFADPPALVNALVGRCYAKACQAAEAVL